MRIYRQRVVKNGKSITVRKWYADVRLSDGRRCRLPLFESKRLSQDFAAKLEDLVAAHGAGRVPDKVTEAWLGQLPQPMISKFVTMGLVDSVRAESNRQIDEHIGDYVDHLYHKGNTERYCKMSKSRVRLVINGCKVRKLADLSAVKIQRFLSDTLSAGSISQGTFNAYIRHMKSFLRWIYQQDRVSKDIGKHLHRRTITEVVKKRRILSVEELSYLFDWLVSHGRNRRKLSGWERMVLYKLAVMTGLRADEIRNLKVGSIDFKNKRIQVPPAHTKNRKEADLPLRDDILDDLKKLVKGKLPATLLFDNLTTMTAAILKADMREARTQWIADGGNKKNDFLKVETPDGEIDFHALRHSYGSMLAAAGVHPSVAQKLMRHSTITLTMDLYTHVYRGSDSVAIDSLPTFEKQKPKKKQA